MANDFSYLEDRIEPQRRWHSDRANWNKNRYYITEIVALLAGGIIPVINVLDIMPDALVRVVSASLAALIVLSSGIAKLYKFQENWLSFRALSEALEREKELFQYAVGEYAPENNLREQALVERIENMLASTTSQFIAVHKAERERSQDSPKPSQRDSS